MLGEEARKTIDVEFSLGITLSELGKDDAAEETFEKVWHKRKTVYGEDDTKTLSTLQQFIQMLCRNGKYATAEYLGREALRVLERSFGRGHWLTIRLSTEMIEALRHRMKYEEVDQLNDRLLQEFMSASGEEQSHLLVEAYDFGVALEAQNRIYDAIGWVLARELKFLGDEHPETLYTQHELALTLCEQGETKEAVDLMRQALYGREKVLGTNHEWTLKSTHELAKICKDIGQHQEALRLTDSCLERSVKLLGADHPSTVSSIMLKEDLLKGGKEKDGVHEVTKHFTAKGSSKSSANPKSRQQADGRSNHQNDTRRSKRARKPGTSRELLVQCTVQ